MNHYKGLKLAVAMLGILLPLSQAGATNRSPKVNPAHELLESKPVIRAQATEKISARTRHRIGRSNQDSIKVWVFFTDKQVFSASDFSLRAASVSLTERAQRRRAKVNRDKVVFADLPVAGEYVRQINQLGAGHRRSSRWLNAASFVVTAAVLEQVEALPFVARIETIARLSGVEPIVVEDRLPQPAAATPGALNYGLSITQLEQINVPAAHARGLSGEGVTLSIIDTGFRKTHDAFAQHYADGRVLAEYDFIFEDGETSNEPEDWASQWNHGTMVWSVAGGYDDGVHYGPAYKANFILCKTEALAYEHTVEEDNFVAALEFSDSVGADVISCSLGYKIFDDSCNCDYTTEDMDGQTAIISIAASLADGLGIVVCKSAGNSGPGVSSLTAPADAFDILTIGAVSSSGLIASFSSRGPTADGRMKPDVCARGVSDRLATTSNDASYGTGSGTSFSTPLVAGAACLVIEAHPDWRPAQVREALRATANRASSPSNVYGWGIIDTEAAIDDSPPCCYGKVGDVNGQRGDEPTIGDIAALVDFLFVSHTPVDCLAEADVNQSGGLNPTAYYITIGDVERLIDHLFITKQDLPDCF